MIESAPAKSLGMKRNGNNKLHRTRFQEFLTALRHEPPEGFAERNFAAVFELLHNLAQWMLGDLLSRVTAPSAGADEIRRARQTSGAMMVISARIRERTAA